MIGLREPSIPPDGVKRVRPITVVVSGGVAGALIAVALRLNLFNLSASVTNEQLSKELAQHHREVQQKADEQLAVLKDLRRLAQVGCLHSAKTELERDQCLETR